MAIKDALNFFREVRIEFSKVQWPTGKETVESFFVVVVFMAISAAFLGGVDFTLSRIVEFLFSHGLQLFL